MNLPANCEIMQFEVSSWVETSVSKICIEVRKTVCLNNLQYAILHRVWYALFRYPLIPIFLVLLDLGKKSF